MNGDPIKDPQPLVVGGTMVNEMVSMNGDPIKDPQTAASGDGKTATLFQ